MRKNLTILSLLFASQSLIYAQVDEVVEEVQSIEAEAESDVIYEAIETEVEEIYSGQEYAEEFYDDEEMDPEMERRAEFPAALMDHPYIRYQNSINELQVAEAYPWISADGLRLYFVKGNSVHYSSRGSRYEDFGPSSEVNLDANGSVTSSWLSNDELKMFTTSGMPRSIREYSRNSTDDDFVFVKQRDLDDRIEGFVSSLSFTPDGRTALIYNNPSSEKQSLVLLDVTPEGKLKFRTRFQMEEGRIGVGQLSKNGKHAYFSLELANDHKIIYKIAVHDLDNPEPRLTKILELKGLRIGKPSLTYDETYMVFNASASDNWQQNEIMVVDLNNLNFISEDTSVFDLTTNMGLPNQLLTESEPKTNVNLNSTQIDKPQPREELNPSASDFELRVAKIFPNPTKSVVTLEYQIPINAEIAQLIVNDMNGREIFRKRIDPQSRSYSIDLREIGVSEGYYLFFLHTELGTSIGSRIFYQSAK
ncbi:MAG: T9SS type A sorting domain-containing protein [Flavobacteriales bacterium]|nr:T9SS type A sorting domain-containing protein [Flavobacteriales bacterium]